MAKVIEYIYQDSTVHSLNPLSKMTWALGVMIMALTFNHPAFLLGLLVLVIGVAGLGKVLIDLSPVFKGLTIFSGILVIMQVFFLQGDRVLFYLVPGGFVPVTREALALGVAMGLRMMTVVLSFLVFLATTQYKDIILVLTEKLKLPYDYVFMFMTALRFVPTFMAEAVQVSAAQQVRGCPIDRGGPLTRVKAYITVALPLVLISLKKAERLAIAMETRGYGSGTRTYLREPAMGRLDLLAILLTISMVILAVFLRIQGLGVIHY